MSTKSERVQSVRGYKQSKPHIRPVLEEWFAQGQAMGVAPIS